MVQKLHLFSFYLQKKFKYEQKGHILARRRLHEDP